MTAYKYVARDAESRVNWGDISKTWSDAILKVEEDREAKRQTIKTETDELSNKLIAAPMGDHEGVNEWTSGYASMMQDALLDRYRLLTSGNLSVRDWNSYIANAKQSTDRMFDLSKAYTTNYEEKMRRYNDQESQQAELAAGEEFEGFTNFTDTVALVDPVTLSARIGKKVYDPETGTYKVGETVTMNEMYNFIQGRYDRFKVQENMATEVDFMKEYTKVVMEDNPAVKTRSDATQDPMFDEQLKSRLSVYLSDGQNVSSILTDSINEGYESTFITDSAFNPDGSVNEKKVLWVLDPRQPNSGAKTPLSGLDLDGMTEEQLDVLFGADLDDEKRSQLIDVAKDQKEQAETFLTTYVKSGINMIETPRAEQAPSQPSAAEKAGLKKTEIGVTNLQKIWGATTLDELRQAIGYFEGLSPNDLKLTVDEIDGVRKLGIKKGDAETKFFDITEDYDGFVEAVSTELLGDVTYVDEAKRLSPLDREKYPTLGTAIGSGQRQRVLDPERIGEERVTVGETTSNVEELLSTITPVSSGMLYGRAIGEGEAEADGKMQEAVFKVGRVLEDLQVGPGVQVRGITVEESGGSFPQVVITVDGEDRVFTMDEGGTPEMVNYVLESIAKVSSQPKKAELD
jgi:hypothetical protein